MKPRMVEDAPRGQTFAGKSDDWIRRELLYWKAIKQISTCPVCGAGLGEDCKIFSDPNSWHNFYDLHYRRWQKYEHLTDLEKAMMVAVYDE